MLCGLEVKSAVPCLMRAVNANGLFYFLLSNVLTGLVNMALPTLHLSAAAAVAVLLGYTFFLSAVIVSMDKNNIWTRFW